VVDLEGGPGWGRTVVHLEGGPRVEWNSGGFRGRAQGGVKLVDLDGRSRVE
jgi:hypothetical protein